MIIYKRNIERKLNSLRLLFVIFLTSGFLLFAKEHSNFAWLIVILFLFFCLIVVTDVRAEINSVTIIKHFFFGFIRVKWNFNKGDELIIRSDGTAFEDEAPIPVAGDESGLGALFGCLVPMFVKTRIGTIQFVIQKIKRSGKASNRVFVFLDENEHNMLQQLRSNNKNGEKENITNL
jgi:hypothetical protein